eukprot:g594.t1
MTFPKFIPKYAAFDTWESVYQECKVRDTFRIERVTPQNLTPSRRKEMMKVMCDSFSGAEGTAPELAVYWQFSGEHLYDEDGNAQKREGPLPTRVERGIKYSMDFCLKVNVGFGGTFVLIEKATDKIVGVVTTVPPNEIHAHDMNEKCFSSCGFCCLFTNALCCSAHACEVVCGMDWKQGAIEYSFAEGHKELANGRHWYVQIMAVAPSAQGKGAGTEMVNFIAALAEKDNVPCYLETAGKENEGFYTSKGKFKTVKHKILSKKGHSDNKVNPEDKNDPDRSFSCNGGMAFMIRDPGQELEPKRD